MNPFVVWMPTIAAAAILTTAAYVSMDEDAIEEPRYEPESPTESVADAADPPALISDAEVDSAARDDDGSDILELMENQLRMARRISSSNKNSTPTKKGRRDLKALANKAGYGLKKLTQMRTTVPDQTFARAEDIVKEIKTLLEEINESYSKYREERSIAPEPVPAPQPMAPTVPPPVAAPVYQPAEPVYESESEGEITEEEEDEQPQPRPMTV
jgi:hypothetical protein